MIETLLGSKSIERVLLFLFVNGKCFGSELSRLFLSPLTPLQKALTRLEKGGILISFFHGKTRIYQFNPAYPLLAELQLLLKKSYLLLAPHEKRRYTSQELILSALSVKEKREICSGFWKRLSEVKELSYISSERDAEKKRGGSGSGKGAVSVSKEGNSLVFVERGTLENERGGVLEFSNSFRWTHDPFNSTISLEHLRYGKENPYFLFYLTPQSKDALISIASHSPSENSYFGQLVTLGGRLRLKWRMIGPEINEEIDYYYS